MVKSSRLEGPSAGRLTPARTEQRVDRGLAADLALLLTIAALSRDLAIGNSVGLVDQDTQPRRRVQARLVEASAVLKCGPDSYDQRQSFPMR